MAKVHNGRFAVTMEDDAVVFLIGMRINRLLLVHKWFPVALSMPRMLRELLRQPDLGLLEAQTFISGRTLMTVQYWRSFDQLHAYAHARDKEHLPAWAAFNRRVGGNGAVGVFHETYKVTAGSFECVYVNMPAILGAKAGEMVPAVGRMNSAKTRISQAEVDERP